MQSLTQKIEAKYAKPHVVNVSSGDTVRVSQKIREGNKERTQVFEGLVIRTRRKKSLTNTITVRRIASGVGVEKSFLLHSPLVEKVEVIKRSKVRRNNLSFMRQRSGKSARLDSVDFDREAVNVVPEVKEEAPVAAEETEAPEAEAPTDTEAKAEVAEAKDEPKAEAEETPAESKEEAPKA